MKSGQTIKTLFLVILFTCFIYVPFANALITIPTDYPTVQEGLERAASGEKVYVLPGVYEEHLVLNLAKEYVLEGADRDTVIIDGTNTGLPLCIITNYEVSLTNLTIQNSDTHGIDINAPDWSGTVSINRCTVRNNANDGIHYAGGFGGFYHDVPHHQYFTITNSIITGNTINGIYLYIVPSYNVTNCEITNNENGVYSDNYLMDRWNSEGGINSNYVANNSNALYLDESEPYDLVIKGNIIEKNTTTALHLGAMRGGNFIIEDNIIQFNTLPDEALVYIYAIMGIDIAINNNTIYSNSAKRGFDLGTFWYGPEQSFKKNTIMENIIDEYLYGAAFRGIGDISNNFLYNNSCDVMFYLGLSSLCHELDFVNNTIFSNTGVSDKIIKVSKYSYSVPVKVNNNIIAYNNTYGLNISSECSINPCEIKNNDVYGNTPADALWDGAEYTDMAMFNAEISFAEGNISCDPEFVTPGDFHIQPSSCCVDAGTSDGAPSTDLDNDPRPMGVGYDIGADEMRPVPVLGFNLLFILPFVLVWRYLRSAV